MLCSAYEQWPPCSRACATPLGVKGPRPWPNDFGTACPAWYPLYLPIHASESLASRHSAAGGSGRHLSERIVALIRGVPIDPRAAILSVASVGSVPSPTHSENDPWPSIEQRTLGGVAATSRDAIRCHFRRCSCQPSTEAGLIPPDF